MNKADQTAIVRDYGDCPDAVALDQDPSVSDRVFGVNEMLVFDPTHHLANRHRSPPPGFDGLDILENEHSEKSFGISDGEGSPAVHWEYLVDKALDGKAGVNCRGQHHL